MDSAGGVMISPVFRFHLPHLLWFLFGCSVLWKVGRLKPDPVAGQIRPDQRRRGYTTNIISINIFQN
ncbi:MAG: hypothetical protein LUQ50_07740 [Methanospirillum sp.]|uniref:hypothetical protein n=1 Tax=Methanospirillum sp. TaxID=45200 RepID=UPI002369654C|nr:hypothetical protein [Methanospirillum sp.]MDD1728947.1 hypothetical protein [Methanospirillum sp.]